MPDYGAKVADRALGTINRKIRATYRKASQELTAKLDEFTRRFKAKDAVMQERLKNGEITEQDYKNWKAGQVFMGKEWERKLDQCARIMSKANREALEIAHEGKMDVFAENYNYSAYELERRANGSLGFNVYNTQSVSKLLQREPQILPKWKIDEKKDYEWNRKKANNSIKQGIIQGESVDQIAQRMAVNLCSQNENKMRNFARTGVTEAQNAGRLEQMEEAEEIGIGVKKRWVATLDSRTRDAHADLDGQEVPVDEPFEVEFDGDLCEIMYPGDPNAEPGLVYNCRCTMIQVYEGIDRVSVRRDDDDIAVRDMTYREWKEAKENGTLDRSERLIEEPDFDD